jgi:hypothetical protein
VQRAASQFLCLAKGELHANWSSVAAQQVLAHEVEAQLEAAWTLFLRGYGTPTALTMVALTSGTQYGCATTAMLSARNAPARA